MCSVHIIYMYIQLFIFVVICLAARTIMQQIGSDEYSAILKPRIIPELYIVSPLAIHFIPWELSTISFSFSVFPLGIFCELNL